MLVIHWALQNKTSSILSNGIKQSLRKRASQPKLKGVYVYPFVRNRFLTGTWRRNLKSWNKRMGNYNGFIFRLKSSDFPLHAGSWMLNAKDPAASSISSIKVLSKRHGKFLSSGVQTGSDDFEIIIPRHITPDRIIRVIKGRKQSPL